MSSSQTVMLSCSRAVLLSSANTADRAQKLQAHHNALPTGGAQNGTFVARQWLRGNITDEPLAGPVAIDEAAT